MNTDMKLNRYRRYLQRFVRPALWLPMAVFEIGVILLCWILVYLSPSRAKRLCEWALKLPGPTWYFGPNTKFSRAADEPQPATAPPPALAETPCSADDQGDRNP
jgi:hypothetical protein